jgi:hypothetical protein
MKKEGFPTVGVVEIDILRKAGFFPGHEDADCRTKKSPKLAASGFMI